MHLFLTSSPTGCPYEGHNHTDGLDPSNHFIELLRDVWPKQPPLGLLLAAFPDDFEGNDAQVAYFRSVFEEAGLPFSDLLIIDRRNAGEFLPLLEQAGFVLLCGGHLPTANAFLMDELHAAEPLQNFDGIIMGISAGTMNCAGLVYIQPEENGEVADPDFCRWADGLNLTDLNISPHFEATCTMKVDGLRIPEEILTPDSYTRPILCLPDGSFVYQHNGKQLLFGEGLLVQNGKWEQLSESGQVLELN